MTFNGTTTRPIEDSAFAVVFFYAHGQQIKKHTYQICELDGIKCPLTLDNEGVATTFNLDNLIWKVYQTILSVNLVSIRLTMYFSSDEVRCQN